MACFQYYGVMPRARETLSSLISSSRFFIHPLESPPTSVIPYYYYHHCHRCQYYQRNRILASAAAAVAPASTAVAKEEPQQRHQHQILRSTDLVALEYSDLNLPDKICEEVGHVRIRQHVNPLSSSFWMPAQVPIWNQVFRDTSLPLMVDIGSGSGRFLIWLAKKNADCRNHLGLEIRQKLVRRADFWVKELALHDIHFMFANATNSFQRLVSTYPGPLMLVSILCPDPHFKNRHHKRRVVQKPLVDSIIKSLAPGGKIFIQSDVHEVALDMRIQFDAESDDLQHVDAIDPTVLCDNEGWLLSNPMGIRSEREIHAEFEGSKIYRRMYQKTT